MTRAVNPAPAAPKKPRASRKGREPLTRERIATSALALIEQVGLSDFSTRRLGAALGCEAMALYNHYPSKDAVLDAVVDVMMRRLTVPPRDPRGWKERARTIARSYRSLSRLHPRAFPLLATRRFNTEASLALLDEIFRTFGEDGLHPRDAVYVFRTVANYCNGTALDELAGAAQSAAAEPVDWAILPLPSLRDAAPFLAPTHFDDVFEFGLDLILDGLAQRVSARA